MHQPYNSDIESLFRLVGDLNERITQLEATVACLLPIDGDGVCLHDIFTIPTQDETDAQDGRLPPGPQDLTGF